MAELRPNRIKHKLAEGKTAILLLGFDEPNSVESIASLGIVDGFMFDMEHGGMTWADLSNLARACDLWGVTSFVRVGAEESFLVSRALDRGLQGVGIPHVNTKAQAQRVVRYTRFAPLGMRAIGGGRQGLGVADYLRKANDENFVMIWIEDVEAVKNLPEILKVDGIDAYFVAPIDLAQTVGPQYLGRHEHPDVAAVADKAIRQIVQAGKVACAFVNDGDVEHHLDLGARLLVMSPQSYIVAGLMNFQKKVAAKVSATAPTGGMRSSKQLV